MASQDRKSVEPCKGWNTACAFCDKRFSKWMQQDDETLLNETLVHSGIFMFAFGTKQGKEVVTIGCHPKDIRSEIQKHFNTLRRQVSQKKQKESKSDILVRYLIAETLESKDSCSIFSHWYNYGILPRLVTKWPGLDPLKNTEHYHFDESCNKWYHPVVDPYWRKQKTIVGPRAIKPCKGWKSKCPFCDSRFTTWVSYKTATETAPSKSGLVMFSLMDKGLREVVLVSAYDNMKSNLFGGYNKIESFLRYDSQGSGAKDIEIRWLLLEDLSSENACFVYAHWINCRVQPMVTGFWEQNKTMPGEEILNKSEMFSFRSRDKQWCYDDSEFQKLPPSLSKTKVKRNVLQDMKDDLVMNV